MSEADAAAECPSGHADVVRLLSVFATVGASTSSPAPSGAAMPAFGGGGCGGHCACHG
jgi:hypothetical protein